MRSEKAFKRAAPLIEKALKYQDTHTLDDVECQLMKDKAQLWCGEKSVIVTEINDYPTGKRARIWLAAGEMDELVNDMLPDVEAWAKGGGCISITIVGRKGWLRKLKDTYEQNYVMLERTL